MTRRMVVVVVDTNDKQADDGWTMQDLALVLSALGAACRARPIPKRRRTVVVAQEEVAQ